MFSRQLWWYIFWSFRLHNVPQLPQRLCQQPGLCVSCQRGGGKGTVFPYNISRKICTWFGFVAVIVSHDDVIRWKHFPRYLPFVRGIHRGSTSGAELWCFLWSTLNKRLCEQSRRRWFEMPLRSLWRHSNEFHWICSFYSPIALRVVSLVLEQWCVRLLFLYEYGFGFCISPMHWNATGRWNASSWKTWVPYNTAPLFYGFSFPVQWQNLLVLYFSIASIHFTLCCITFIAKGPLLRKKRLIHLLGISGHYVYLQ